ncbi:MAG: DinB family protein [Acidobacteriota bacterium]|nr:DinB family protein [Acidobacteriota bacterium]
MGQLVRHVFSAEQRYVERLLDQPITDPPNIPANDIEALFQFGQQSRREFMRFIEEFPSEEWDVPREFQIMSRSLTATPKKIVTHVLLHEIRHWAQIATILRLDGLKDDFHDFLFSPVMGGELRRSP